MKIFLDIGLRAASTLAKAHPEARHLRDVTELSGDDIDYRGTGQAAHTLEVLRPKGSSATLPVLLFVHGGGFRILDRKTHRVPARRFAERGFVVVSINYRLTPEGAYPGAVEDVCAALEWTLDHAADFGGDCSRLAYAGESAGANLSLVLAILGAYRRDERWAAAIYDRQPNPACILPACGLFEVHRAERYLEDESLPSWVRRRIQIVCEEYLGPAEGEAELASPLRFLEAHLEPDRPLPPIFAICGSQDPVAEDTRRLGRLLEGRGQPGSVRFYEGSHHAFHYLFTDNARRAWQDQFAFLDRHIA